MPSGPTAGSRGSVASSFHSSPNACTSVYEPSGSSFVRCSLRRLRHQLMCCLAMVVRTYASGLSLLRTRFQESLSLSSASWTRSAASSALPVST
ncbi:hypothetical protein [Nonomuraea candida]|uniref:hypothetical protein n=1 Tax=Nonomuraea candida TaxID=359159 RepID=UPI001FE04561|nr:hypothetical protein [Nonomuraea candida]